MKKKLFIAALLMVAGTMAFSAGAEEAVTEEISVTDEMETEKEIPVPQDENFGKWTQLGYDVGDFALNLYSLYILPDAVSDNEGTYQSYEVSDDGSLTIAASEDELPDEISAFSYVFTPRILEAEDLETYRVTESDAAVAGQTPVLEVTTYVTLTTNPLSPEDTVSSSLYSYDGYKDSYIECLLMEHPWTVGGKRLTFVIPEGEVTGIMDLNDGESTGEFFVYGGRIRMEWGENVFNYTLQSISTDAETRGNVILVEENKPDRTLELEVAQGDAPEEKITE